MQQASSSAPGTHSREIDASCASPAIRTGTAVGRTGSAHSFRPRWSSHRGTTSTRTSFAVRSIASKRTGRNFSITFMLVRACSVSSVVRNRPAPAIAIGIIS